MEEAADACLAVFKAAFLGRKPGRYGHAVVGRTTHRGSQAKPAEWLKPIG